MAFTSSLSETNIGIPLENTYARIVSMTCDKDRTMIFVAHYANSNARATNAIPVFERPFRVPTSELQPGTDPLAIGYAWLKTQPEYANAEDC